MVAFACSPRGFPPWPTPDAAAGYCNGRAGCATPTLLKLTAGLFVLTLFIPDPIPFVDELVLGFGTLLLANWKSRNATPPPPLEQR